MSPIIYRDARNWKQKLRENWNDNIILIRFLIESRNISRSSKIENGSSYQIQTTITFYSDVWLSPVIYQDSQNFNPKLWENWIDNNFIHGCPIESHNISRRCLLKTDARSKFRWQRLFTQISDRVLLYIQMLQFENGSSYQSQMTITFFSNVRLSPVI